MRMNIEIRPFDVRSASQDDWERLGAFLESFSSEFWPDEAIDGNTRRTMLQAELEETEMVMYTAVDLEQEDRIVSVSRLSVLKESSPSYEENRHICSVIGPNVIKEYRGNGLATQFLPLICDETERRGKSSIVGYTLNETGRILVQKVGGKLAQQTQRNRLTLSDVDWNMVKQWVEEGPRRSPETQMEFHHSIPDDMLERYCEVLTEVFNQAPRDELEVGDWVVTPESWQARMNKYAEADMKYLAAVTVEKDGAISGLTDVGWFPSRPAVLDQWFTGVREKYRGRGLGKWLKGAVLLRASEEFPSVTVVVTGNAASNEPMLDINRRLGFKHHMDIYTYQLELEQLKNYLKQ